MAAGCRQTERYLEAVVDEPLEGRQCANLRRMLVGLERRGSGVEIYHDDSDGQAVPEAFEADVAVDPAHCLPRTFARCGHVNIQVSFHESFRRRD